MTGLLPRIFISIIPRPFCLRCHPPRSEWRDWPPPLMLPPAPIPERAMKVSDAPHEARLVDGVATSSPGRVWKVGTLTYTFDGLRALFTWLLFGDFSLAVRDRALQGVVQLLFERFGASDMFSGVLLASVPSALGLIIGPVVGYKSDRLRTRWGRRIPFLIVTTPFMVLALVGMAFAPQLGHGLQHLLGPHSPGTASSVLLFLGLFWIVFEIALIVSGSVFGALLNDVVPQEVIGRFFGLFRAVSLIVGIFFFYNLGGDVETHAALILLVVAVIYGVGFTLMCLKVKEGNYPPTHEASKGPASALSSVKNYFKDGFGQPFYLWFFASGILWNMANAPFGLYCIYYAKSVSMNLGTFGKCIALTYCFSLVLSYPLGWLADRFHPLRLSLLFVTLYGVAMATGYLLVHDARTFGFALIANTLIVGCINTSSASIGQRLLPRDKFAEIGSAGGVLNSLVGIFLAPSIGLILDYEKHDYRYTFLMGFIFTASALAVLVVLYAKFLALGGPKNYIAPDTVATTS
jgi:MFS family permease